MKSDLVDLKVMIHSETPKAYFVSDTGDRNDAKWIPKSQCEIFEDPSTYEITLTIPVWLAEEKGFI